jgi:hypothetical protein
MTDAAKTPFSVVPAARMHARYSSSESTSHRARLACSVPGSKYSCGWPATPVLSSSPDRSQVPLRCPLQMKYELVGEVGCS